MIKDIFWTEADQLIMEVTKKADQKADQRVEEAEKKTARNMLRDGVSAKKIVQYTGLDLETVKSLRKELMAEAAPA